MILRFFALLIALSVMGTSLAACGGGSGGMSVHNAGNGGGNDGCSDSDGTPCAPPPTCLFPTGVAPSLVAPANNAIVAAATLSQIVIADTATAPYQRAAWQIVVSVDSDPDDLTNALSPYVSTTTLAQQGSSNNEFGTLPKNALNPGTQYFAYIVTSGCAAAGPIGQFFTS